MQMNTEIRSNGLYYCCHLGYLPYDKSDITTFFVRNPNGYGLEKYIKNCAFYDEKYHLMRTYIVRSEETNELVGYFSLKARLITSNIHNSNGSNQTETLPGVELANFAINSAFTEKYNIINIGISIFNGFILPIITDVSQHIAIKIIYIYALPFDRLIEHYTKYGFQRMSADIENLIHSYIKPAYDQGCIFMYQPLP